MRTLAATSFIALTTLSVACGGNDVKPDAPPIVVPDAAIDAFVPDAPPDAQVFDFTCMNNPAPTTAPATITLSGTTQNFNLLAMMLEPVANAAVVTRNAADQMVGAPTTSDMQGNFTLANLPTQNAPIDGYLEASKQGNRTARVYPPQPMNADQAMIPVPLLSNTTFGLIQQGAGVTQDPANGSVGLVILDCAGTAINGATISVKQGGVEVGEQFDAGAFFPGTWFIFNVPPGATEVGATINAMPLRTHTIGSAAATTSGTIVNPGFI